MVEEEIVDHNFRIAACASSVQNPQSASFGVDIHGNGVLQLIAHAPFLSLGVEKSFASDSIAFALVEPRELDERWIGDVIEARAPRKGDEETVPENRGAGDVVSGVDAVFLEIPADHLGGQ